MSALGQKETLTAASHDASDRPAGGDQSEVPGDRRGTVPPPWKILGMWGLMRRWQLGWLLRWDRTFVGVFLGYMVVVVVGQVRTSAGELSNR